MPISLIPSLSFTLDPASSNTLETLVSKLTDAISDLNSAVAANTAAISALADRLATQDVVNDTELAGIAAAAQTIRDNTTSIAALAVQPAPAPAPAP